MGAKIFVSASTFSQESDEPLELLKQSGLTYEINSLGKRLVQAEIIAMGKDCEGVIAGLEPYDDDVLERLVHLRCISRVGVGLDSISLEMARQKKITILNTPNVVIQPVAELTIALALDLLKRLSLHTALMKSGRWQKITGNLLFGKMVGIVGLGRIGRRAAELFVALGARVYGSDPFADEGWATQHGITLLETEQLLRSCDIVSLHLAYIQDKPFRMSDKEIGTMKDGAMLINVSRGRFIDEAALYSALQTKHLSGAALDVFEQEPYTGKLCELDNMVLTPHIATLTRESRIEMEVAATRNLIHFFGAQ